MYAMEGLFLVLVQSLEFRTRLAERGVIRCAGMKAQQIAGEASNWEPLLTATTDAVIATSSLFGYKFLSRGSATHASSVSEFLA
jgi:hypothetical protein